MRKLVTCFAVLVALLVLHQNASAQFFSSNWFGVRAGVSLANESYDPALPDYITTSMKVGALGGLQFDHVFPGDAWAVSIQALYDMKGLHEELSSSVAGSPFSTDGTSDLTLSYLEVPILAKYIFSDDNFQPYVFAGPSIGFLLSSKSETNMGSVSSTSTSKDFIQSTDISAYFGVGFNYKLTNDNVLLLDAGYAAGLTNLSKDDGTSTDPTSKVKSGDIRIAIGMLWRM